MLGTKQTPLRVQSRNQQFLRLCVFALQIRKVTQAAHRPQSLFAIRPELGAVQTERALQLNPAVRVEPKIHVSLPDGLSEGSLHLRLPIELARDLRCRSI